MDRLPWEPPEIELLREGKVEAWNAFRSQTSRLPSLARCRLSGARLSYLHYIAETLMTQHLEDFEPLIGVDLSGMDLRAADLSYVDLRRANLRGANLEEANLVGADLVEAVLDRADLTKADLGWARLVRTSVEQARFRGARVYGSSIWDLRGEPADQTDLVVTPTVAHQLPSIRYERDFQTAVTVDDLEVAQFMYVLLNNNKVRDIIDTMTSKVVLILGRFTAERKKILDMVRSELRKGSLVPILFDFQKPTTKDTTGAVELLARMAQFVIADLTDPSSIPHELATIVPFLRTTPVAPIRAVGASGYTMFEDLQRAYRWVLPTHEYADQDGLMADLPQVVHRAQRLSQEMRRDRPKT